MLIKNSFTVRIVCMVTLLGGLMPCEQSFAQPLRIAAAASLRQVMPQLVKQVPEGLQVVVAYGASGTLYQQIKHGAPFDVFMSADTALPERLAEEYSAKAKVASNATLNKPIVYAHGQLALIGHSRLFEPDQPPQQQLAAWLGHVKSTKRGKLAIANPNHAPYGQLAQRYLQQTGLWQTVQPHLVVGENISQTVQFVLSGHADFALGALSLMPQKQTPQALSTLSVLPIPPNILPLLPHALWVVRPSNASTEWVNYLRSAQAQTIWQAYGFTSVNLQNE